MESGRGTERSSPVIEENSDGFRAKISVRLRGSCSFVRSSFVGWVGAALETEGVVFGGAAERANVLEGVVRATVSTVPTSCVPEGAARLVVGEGEESPVFEPTDGRISVRHLLRVALARLVASLGADEAVGCGRGLGSTRLPRWKGTRGGIGLTAASI